MAYSLKAAVKTLAGIGSADTVWDSDIDNTHIPMADREIDLYLQDAGAAVPLVVMPAIIADISALLAASLWWEARITVLEPAAAGQEASKRSYLRKRALEMLKQYIAFTYSENVDLDRIDHALDDFYIIYPRDYSTADGK